MKFVHKYALFLTDFKKACDLISLLSSEIHNHTIFEARLKVVIARTTSKKHHNKNLGILSIQQSCDNDKKLTTNTSTWATVQTMFEGRRKDLRLFFFKYKKLLPSTFLLLTNETDQELSKKNRFEFVKSSPSHKKIDFPAYFHSRTIL